MSAHCTCPAGIEGRVGSVSRFKWCAARPVHWVSPRPSMQHYIYSAVPASYVISMLACTRGLGVVEPGSNGLLQI